MLISVSVQLVCVLSASLITKSTRLHIALSMDEKGLANDGECDNSIDTKLRSLRNSMLYTVFGLAAWIVISCFFCGILLQGDSIYRTQRSEASIIRLEEALEHERVIRIMNDFILGIGPSYTEDTITIMVSTRQQPFVEDQARKRRLTISCSLVTGDVAVHESAAVNMQLCSLKHMAT